MNQIRALSVQDFAELIDRPIVALSVQISEIYEGIGNREPPYRQSVILVVFTSWAWSADHVLDPEFGQAQGQFVNVDLSSTHWVWVVAERQVHHFHLATQFLTCRKRNATASAGG